ncbi:MAG: response regulator [Alphaproteobacteria bacterium]|nr:response regulator [Alphaproteobacteria bacterium]
MAPEIEQETEQQHILVVDDEPGIRTLLERYLTRQGYRVTAAADGKAMDAVLEHEKVDLVILDLVMPGEDGLTLTRRLRESAVSRDAAIIILTLKDEMVDRVVGLEMGADDYMTKPFNTRELHARVKSVLRRAKAPPSASGAAVENSQKLAEMADTAYLFAGWRLDHTNRELTSPTGRPVALTKGEFTLLTVFLRNPNRLLNRDQLTEQVHNRAWSPFDRGIDVQIGRLRRKLKEENAETPELIKTVRGGGYMLATDVTEETIRR